MITIEKNEVLEMALKSNLVQPPLAPSFRGKGIATSIRSIIIAFVSWFADAEGSKKTYHGSTPVTKDNIKSFDIKKGFLSIVAYMDITITVLEEGKVIDVIRKPNQPVRLTTEDYVYIQRYSPNELFVETKESDTINEKTGVRNVYAVMVLKPLTDAEKALNAETTKKAAKKLETT